MERNFSQGENAATIEFLKAAHQNGAIERYKSHPLKNSAQNLNILGLYWGTYLEQTDIAQKLGVTRQAVSQSIKSAIKNIWMQCDTETKAKHPLQSLPTKKDYGLSLGQFEKTYKASQLSSLMVNGLKSKEIAQKLDLRVEFVRSYISSKTEPKENPQAETRQKIKEAKSTIKNIILNSDDSTLVQTALDIQTLGMANKLIEENSDQFIPLSHFFRTHPTRKFAELAQELINSSLPVMRILRGHTKKNSYPIINYYVRSRDQEKIKNYLTQYSAHDPSHSNIEVLCGSVVELPKTTVLERNYRRVFTGVARNALQPRLREKGFSAHLFLHDSPVTILRYNNCYYVDPDDYGKLQEFLKMKLEKFRLR